MSAAYLTRTEFEDMLGELLHHYDVGDECGTDEWPCSGTPKFHQDMAREVVDWLVERGAFMTARRCYPEGHFPRVSS